MASNQSGSAGCRHTLGQAASRKLSAIPALRTPARRCATRLEKAPDIFVLLGRVAAGAERGISSREPTPSAVGRDRAIGMPRRLVLNVTHGLPKIPGTHRSQVITSRPSQAGQTDLVVPIGKPRTRSFEPLDQFRDAELRRHADDHVDVVGYDAYRDDLGPELPRRCRKKIPQELLFSYADHRSAIDGCPRQVSVELHSHCKRLTPPPATATIESLHAGHQLLRVLSGRFAEGAERGISSREPTPDSRSGVENAGSATSDAP